jgi:hypothetical protein
MITVIMIDGGEIINHQPSMRNENEVSIWLDHQ